jgi:hypothetical protein
MRAQFDYLPPEVAPSLAFSVNIFLSSMEVNPGVMRIFVLVIVVAFIPSFI